MDSNEVLAGINVFKVNKVNQDIFGCPRTIVSTANDETGVKALIKRPEGLKSALTALDHTGGMQNLAVAALQPHQLPVVVVNIRRYMILPGP